MNISSSSWISLFGVLVAACAVQAAFFYNPPCICNGRARYCMWGEGGLQCINCEGNFEGLQCERCKDGFYQQTGEVNCMPCDCNTIGSVSATCDSGGRCSCKEGVTGDKCNSCPDGPIGPDGCRQRRQTREAAGSQSPPCFCYGHSSRCSAQSGYSAYNITTTFADGPDGWRAATAHGVTPHDVHFRWSPKHQDLEVISKNSLPVYLYAPAPYLGNQLLSYGQKFIFSLRLDRGVRHPSTNDVILEGAGGLRVSASLGDLRSIVPCGQKITYSFRLDERPGSRWRPQLSSFQFQTLLQDITAIKIRATFGENGRGYLDNVKLESARRGSGVPAGWVQTCTCPRGYEGESCERCAAGFRRTTPADGAFSSCEPCNCRGGSCDPQTGDCYSADETPGDRSCSEGFYRDPLPQACVKCPCPEGVSCSLPAGSLSPRCDLCPPGTTGSRCDVCEEGFYGDPGRGDSVRRPCRPCQCNGHIDVSVAGSCDRNSGECLKCVNNTRGRSCETCRPGFYHRRPTDACKPCDCDVAGSESRQCDDSGRCRCRPGFEGSRCERSNCPACFSPIKVKMEAYAAKLQELQRLFSEMDGGLKPTNSAEMEATLRAMDELVNDMQDSTKQLTEMEEDLKAQLSSISRSQLTVGQDIQNMAVAADDIKQRQQTYKTMVETVQTLTEEMRRKLEEAKTKLQSAEFPLGDAPLGSNFLSSLVQTAMSLADKHQTKADAVERSANEALSDSEKSLSLVRTLMNKENKVKELIGDLKTTYDQISAQAKGLENRVTRLSGEARDESKMADGMLKDIANMERDVPSPLKEELDAMVTRLDGLKEAVDGSILGYEALQDSVQRDKAATENLLAKGKSAQQEFDKLRDRVDIAKVDTEGALQRITNNMGELEDALNTLKGFDQQIDGSRSLADAAIERLPAINATIQQAVNNNAETLSVLGDVSDDYNNALGTINLLEDLVNNLEGAVGSLPSHAGLANEATKLNQDATGLRGDAATTARDLALELDNARGKEADAQEAAVGAAAAFNNARDAKDAVGKTLRDISSMLANMNKPGVVDESQLKRLEDSLANAQRDVEGQLRPRLRDMEDQEVAQRRRLLGINTDIDTILGDITNLEDILRAIPKGCYNSPPIEEA